MSCDALGEFARCAWCGQEHEDLGGYAVGYEIALQKFDAEGTLETLDALHDGYLCDGCARIANAARQLLQACRADYANADGLSVPGEAGADLLTGAAAACEKHGCQELAKLLRRMAREIRAAVAQATGED